VDNIIPEEDQSEVDSILFGSAAPGQFRFRIEAEEVMNRWHRASSKQAVNTEMFPSVQRDPWVKLFVKYNTPLPSSAAVERLFCMGGDILRAKRSTLTNSHFEQLIFIKGNMELLDIMVNESAVRLLSILKKFAEKILFVRNFSLFIFF